MHFSFFIGLGFIGYFSQSDSVFRSLESCVAVSLRVACSILIPYGEVSRATALVYMIFPYTLLFATVATFLWPRFWGGFYRVCRA